MFGGAKEVLRLKQKHSPKRPQQRTTKTSAKGGKRPLRFRSSTRWSSLGGQGREGRSGRRRLHAQPLLRLREATKRAGPAEKVCRACQFSRFNQSDVGWSLSGAGPGPVSPTRTRLFESPAQKRAAALANSARPYRRGDWMHAGDSSLRISGAAVRAFFSCL